MSPATRLSHHAEIINLYSTRNTSQLADAKQDEPVVIGGMITKTRYHITQKGRNAGSKMAVFILEDLQGQAEVVLFPESLEKNAALLKEDTVIFVKGKLDCRREKPNVIADELIALEKAHEKLANKVRIRLDAAEVSKEKIAMIRDICEHHQRQKQPLCFGKNRQRQSLRRRRQKSVRQPRPRILPKNETNRRRPKLPANRLI